MAGSNKRVLVVGLGVSGLAVAQFLAAHGAKLVLSDRCADVARGPLPAGALHLGAEDPAGSTASICRHQSGGTSRFTSFAGWPRKTIPVIGEIELASRFLNAPIAAITGTNGKSTVS